DVLREHQDAETGLPRAQQDRGAQPVVGVAGRHPHVDHGDVGLVRAHLSHEVLGVAGLPDHLEPRVLEQHHDALPQEYGVLCNDYPHGISARTTVPPPWGLSMRSDPPSAATRSESPLSPVPRRGSAPPTPSARTSTTACPLLHVNVTLASPAWAYFATFVSASATVK